jgi:hypothetical protein
MKTLYSSNFVSSVFRCPFALDPYLLIADRELALSLFVVLGERLQFLHWFCLQDGREEFDVLFCVFVARLHWSALRLLDWQNSGTHIDFGIIR